MDDFNYLEEPPPPARRVVNKAESRKSDLFIGLPKASSAPSGGRDSGAVAKGGSGKGALLSLAVLVVLGVQGWLLHDARRDVRDLRTALEQTHGSLGLVWESSKRLDQDWMVRLAQLADSVRSMVDSAQVGVRLWEQRLDSVMTVRLDDFARADLAERSRMDALERQNRTYSTAFEALVRRAQSQEASTRDVNTSIASLRASLGRLDADLAAVERSNSGYGQLTRRVESLSGWADGFRQAGLSGEAVQGRFSALSDELRRIRVRVDSLRPMGRTVISDVR